MAQLKKAIVHSQCLPQQRINQKWSLVGLDFWEVHFPQTVINWQAEWLTFELFDRSHWDQLNGSSEVKWESEVSVVAFLLLNPVFPRTCCQALTLPHTHGRNLDCILVRMLFSVWVRSLQLGCASLDLRMACIWAASFLAEQWQWAFRVQSTPCCAGRELKQG